MTQRNKVLLIGWDAADWKVIHPLMDAGLMPNLNAMVDRGTAGNLATLSPVFSPMLWSSIATGKRPYKHGVHGFTEPTPDGKSVRPITSFARKTHAIWNITTLQGLKSNVVGWWPSNPAEPINGVMVSNLYQSAPKDDSADWPMLPGTVHPPRLNDVLEELRWHPNELTGQDLAMFLPYGDEIDQDKDQRIKSVAKIVSDATSIQAAATHLMVTEPWDFMAVYFDAIDHFGHGFMKYHPPKQDIVSEEDFRLYHQVVTAGYIYHDQMLGRLLELAGEDTTVMLISDHGFHPDHLRPQRLPMEPAGPAVEHRDQGIFVLAGPGIKADHRIDGANLLDIAPTILTLLGLPVGDDMDGRTLVQAFETPPDVQSIPSWDDVAGDAGRARDEIEMDADEARENLEQLVALGYIDRPDDDATVSVVHAKREQTYNLALSYMDAGMHPKAAELLAELYRTYPLEFRFGLRLALCLQASEHIDAMAQVVDHLSRNWQQAAQHASASVEHFADKIKARRASLDPDADDLEEATHAELAVAVEDVDDDAPDQPAPILMTPQERDVLKRMSAIAHGNPAILENLSANIALARKNPALAMEHLARVQDSQFKSPNFCIQRGNAFLALRDFDKAISSFEAALALDNESPAAFLGLCRAYLRKIDPENALRCAKAAIGLKFASPPAHYYAALAMYKQDKAADAVQALHVALSQNPNFPEVHVLLSVIYRRALGDNDASMLHRAQARTIRMARRKQIEEAPKLQLPDLPEIDLDVELPKWPSDPTLVPMLLNVPQDVSGFDTSKQTIIVSGLPRSGTSMAMQMLAAGGIPILSDDTRPADENNPLGYLEYEPVKGLSIDNTWLAKAEGKALKVVAPLMHRMPQGPNYKVIMMQRDVGEIVTSQTRMLGRLDKTGTDMKADAMAKMYTEQLERLDILFTAHNVEILRLRHRDVIADPLNAANQIAQFLGRRLDTAVMSKVVDRSLWRERSDAEASA